MIDASTYSVVDASTNEVIAPEDAWTRTFMPDLARKWPGLDSDVELAEWRLTTEGCLTLHVELVNGLIEDCTVEEGYRVVIPPTRDLISALGDISASIKSLEQTLSDICYDNGAVISPLSVLNDNLRQLTNATYLRR